MAINDISLTSGMRSNLISLQGTVDLLNRTQERLSTGKKVNSALDNPTSFFAAQALNSKAAALSSFKDGMSNAIQTVKSANTGLTGITTLIESAKAVAASAKAAGTGTANVTGSISVGTVTAGQTITVGGTTYTAVAGNANTTTQFGIGSSSSETAFNLAALINSGTETTDFSATSVAGTTVNVKRTVAADVLAGDITFPGAQTSMSTGLVAANSERGNLAGQYNTIVAQIDLMATDSGFKGVNFLASNSLDVFFDTGTSDKLTITGFDGSSTGIGMSAAATSGWAVNANIDTDITAMDAALATIKTEASKLASNLSVINARQEWSKSAIDNLTQGADKLTLADMNEEGANMLMLQTRQALGTTALSLSAQAAQSVLKLF
jgi:flagellin